MIRPAWVVIQAIKVIKLHIEQHPDYLRHIFSDGNGLNLHFDDQNQYTQALEVFQAFDSHRPIQIFTSEQVSNNAFPCISVLEEFTDQRTAFGSGEGQPLFVSDDGLSSKLLREISQVTVSVNIFSDRRAEVDIVSHAIHCGLLGLRHMLSFSGMGTPAITKQPFTRLYEGMEDQDSRFAQSILVSTLFEFDVPPIDNLFGDVRTVSVNGMAVADDQTHHSDIN